MSVEPSQPPDDPLVGQTICGCQILALISQGGMGKLYRARQLSLDRTVAVKVLAPSLGANREFLGRFRREARSLANLLHPNIVAVHDFGEEGEVHAIVMEYVEGESVADMLSRTNILPIPIAVGIVRQVAEGLACAHAKHIIHCDLKPENILVTPDGVAKVVDFGLAKSVRGDASRVTQDGAILGTPTYMSPEQCEGAELDGRTDIYSLGATFYRMVAGRDAFEGENAFAIMLKHQKESPQDPHRLNPNVPAALAAVLLRMLEKPREKRYQAASEVVDVLRAFERGEAPSPPEGTEEVELPRHEFATLREAVEAGLLDPGRLREALARQADTEAAADLPSRLVEAGLLTKEQLRQLAELARAREEVGGDEQFARLAVEAGMATEEQVAACLRRLHASAAAGAEARLSRAMVTEGILRTQQVIELLVRQLKRAQQREDAELLEVLGREGALSAADVERCVREQRRQEAMGHPRVLRQVIVELGILPTARLRALLRRQLRRDLERLLDERERAGAPAEAIMPGEEELKLDDDEPCPRCGDAVPRTATVCPACGCRLREARRAAAQHAAGAAASPLAPEQQAEGAPAPKAPAAAGHWEIRLPDGEPSRPLGFAALVKLARERRLTAHTVLRGPLTGGVWRQARHTPKLCRLFGACHYCEAKLPPNAAQCPSCKADPDKPREE